jgi:hypothetical protein
MRTYKIDIVIYSLVGKEVRTIEVKAKNEESAKRKVHGIMGNREYAIQRIRD